MKKSVLYLLPILLLTSCNKVEYIDFEGLFNEIHDRVYGDYIGCNVINSYDNYEDYTSFAINNFSNYSFYTLNPKDAIQTNLPGFYPSFEVAYNDYTLPYDTTVPIKVIGAIHFVEKYVILNKELKSLDESTISDSNKEDGLGTHSIIIQSVFYPTTYDEKEYTLKIDYAQKYMRIKVEGKYSTLGYIYTSCSIDSLVYKDIIMNYVKSNLEYHAKK